MQAALRRTVASTFLLGVLALFAPPSTAQARNGRSARVVRVPGLPPLRGVGAHVAVQPIDGPNGEPLRGLVARIVRSRGYRPMTSLPKYEGTGQYPLLARDHTLAAFVTADLEERGTRQSITFLVWNGANGSVVGRWTASAPSPALARAVGRGFWPHLGPAIARAHAPQPRDYMPPAAPMRIDASDGTGTSRSRFAERE